MIHMEYYLVVSTIMMFAGIYRNLRSIQVRNLDDLKW